MARIPGWDGPSGLSDALERWVDPVLAQAGFELSSVVLTEDERIVGAVYEADPGGFVHRYPQTGLGDDWDDEVPDTCVDLWLKFHLDTRRTELEVEGFEVLEHLHAVGHAELADRVTRLSGDADADAQMIATALALVLDVPGPDLAPRNHHRSG
jgi:hypothetical protein